MGLFGIKLGKVGKFVGNVGMGYLTGGLGGAALGALSGGGGGGGMTPEMSPAYGAAMQGVQQQLQNPQGYSPEMMAQMRSELMQMVNQQKAQALAQLRARMIQTGTYDPGRYAQAAAKVNAGYADASVRGVAQLMAGSAEQRQSAYNTAMAYGLQGQPMYAQNQQQGADAMSTFASNLAGSNPSGFEKLFGKPAPKPAVSGSIPAGYKPFANMGAGSGAAFAGGPLGTPSALVGVGALPGGYAGNANAFMNQGTPSSYGGLVKRQNANAFMNRR